MFNYRIYLIINFICLLQLYVASRPLLALPVGCILAVNRCVPKWIKLSRGFIDAESVKDNLIEVCTYRVSVEKNGEEKKA
jgi:hypothetical protein